MCACGRIELIEVVRWYWTVVVTSFNYVTIVVKLSTEEKDSTEIVHCCLLE